MNSFSGVCPICGEKMMITKLHCRNCHTTLEGRFAVSKISGLSEEQQDFVELFVKCRGNLKEVGKELDLSYPTVRNRLDEVIRALGYPIKEDIEAEEDMEDEKLSILDSIESGSMSVDEAINKLKTMKKEE